MTIGDRIVKIWFAIGFKIESGIYGVQVVLEYFSGDREPAESLKGEDNTSVRLFILFLQTVVLCVLSAPVQAQKITKELIRSEGKDRAYYLFVPDRIDASKKAPPIVLLHGSGRAGITLVEKWKDLAKKEGIILAGPDSIDSATRSIPRDGPDFLHELIEHLKTK